eukprot:scaffold37412_cov30-Tisochrysis_lutea.AAC.1
MNKPLPFHTRRILLGAWRLGDAKDSGEGLFSRAGLWRARFCDCGPRVVEPRRIPSRRSGIPPAAVFIGWIHALSCAAPIGIWQSRAITPRDPQLGSSSLSA